MQEIQKTYPEINAINSVKECNLALRMGYNTIDGVKPEFKAELQSRLAAIEDRRRRLLATSKHIQKTQGAR